MLTVKHIRFDGAEAIDYCQRVLFNPSVNRDQLDTPCPHWDGWVHLVDAIRGRDIDYGDGIVYVMNEAGSTVAKYDLGNNPRPTPAPMTAYEAHGDQATLRGMKTA